MKTEEMEIYYNVLLDENKYYKVGEFRSTSKTPEGMISVSSFPPNLNESLWPAYKYVNNEWILDEEKLKSIQENVSKQESIEKKYFEIDELKKKLLDTDYNAIKCLEKIIEHFTKILSLGDYESIGKSREEWRSKINELEEEIKKIEEGGK